MPRFDQPIEPMTLGNMRELGVRSLFAACRVLDFGNGCTVLPLAITRRC
jgi:hypothetical protein